MQQQQGNNQWEAQAVLLDVRDILKRTPNLGFTWTPREGNALAHNIASMQQAGGLNRNWCSDPPLIIKEIAEAEQRQSQARQRQHQRSMEEEPPNLTHSS
ncbi:hypothetical protein PIB30_003909 [Stylosanthes scabra]|uniref:RNase H type-1 domain-containing protein n=1 Tax=Stylosanthes scabra TaxID=79078 RepID=A0ABU6U2C4_9FABA|nr:hypothetical protein [Stylosanthes scabra]